MSDALPSMGVGQVHPTAWVAPGAIVLGAVTLGPDSSIWYGCVLRGDNDVIEVGAGSNIQDLTVMHVDPGFPCRIGAGVTVGHRAILHGCTVGDGALIGMGAIILNGAVIEAGAVVAAGALVPEGRVIPAGMLAVGAPAQIRRRVEGELAERRDLTWRHYVRQASRHREMWINKSGG